MPTLAQARKHYARQRTVTALALRAVRAVVRKTQNPVAAAQVVAAYQLTSATTSSRAIAAMSGSRPLARPAAFVGHTAAGYPLADPLDVILAAHERDMLVRLDRFVASEIADAGRSASQVEIVARPEWTNYVRMLNLPSCARCAILAGRVYRDLDHFPRHDNCDCVMVPVTGWQEAHDAGLITSPQDAFDKGLIRGLSQADAQAITDGADIAKVVNATRGMRTVDIFGHRAKVTTAGTKKGQPVRLRPEAIYASAKDREDAIRLLRLYGYIL